MDDSYLSDMKGKGNKAPKPPASGGIPSAESLWLPSHYGGKIKKKGGLDKTVYWSVEDVCDFIFPANLQPTYHKVATDFLDLLLTEGMVTKKEIKKFLEENGYSKSTLENKIIPKIVRFGLAKREREYKTGLGKSRGLILTPSLTFANYLEKIGFSWNMLVSTQRKKVRPRGS
ncbi:hypothetical protein ACFLRF_05095 [Candidatus Altiarchaeota archaeon]